MRVYISAKQIKKRIKPVTSYPYVLESVPETLRQLIAMLVSEGVQSYNQRLQQKDNTNVLTQDDIDTMSQIGKIGFGIPFGSREASLDDAFVTAIQGFEDGLYRVFVGEQEIEFLDTPLHLQEEDTITIIRLVMLTGGFF